MPKAIQLQWIQTVGTHLVPGSPGACRAPCGTFPRLTPAPPSTKPGGPPPSSRPSTPFPALDPPEK